MAKAEKVTGASTRWWWVRHAPVPNPEARCYGQSDKDCDVSNEALFKHQAALLPKGAVWYSSNLLRARKTAEHLKSGSQEVWLLDLSNQEIFIHAATSVRLLRAGDLLQSEVLPGFSVLVSDLLSAAI